VVEGESLPGAERVGDQDEPCGDPIPQAPQKILPPHRHSLHVGRCSGGAPTRVRLIRELIGPRAPPAIPLGGALEQLPGGCPVDVQHCVELVRETRGSTSRNGSRKASWATSSKSASKLPSSPGRTRLRSPGRPNRSPLSRYHDASSGRSGTPCRRGAPARA